MALMIGFIKTALATLKIPADAKDNTTDAAIPFFRLFSSLLPKNWERRMENPLVSPKQNTVNTP